MAKKRYIPKILNSANNQRKHDMVNDHSDNSDFIDIEMLDKMMGKLGINEEELLDKMQDFIIKTTPQQWSELHYPCKIAPSDKFYADLCSRIIERLLDIAYKVPVSPDILNVRQIAFTVTAYLEDIVSGIGVWQSFKSLYKDKYGSELPFYDCNHDDYIPEEVNKEDIKLLIWGSICHNGFDEDTIYSPVSDAIESMAEMIFPIISEAYESAPEAVQFKRWVDTILRNAKFYEIRELAKNLVLLNPITTSYGFKDIILNEIDENFEMSGKLNADIIQYKDIFEYHIIAQLAMKREIGLLGYPAMTYIAQMATDRGLTEQAKIYSETDTSRRSQQYTLTQITRNSFILTDKCGETFEVAKNKFTSTDGFYEGIMLNPVLIRFNGKWEVNGMVSGSDNIKKRNNDSDFQDLIDESTMFYPKGNDFYNEIVKKHDGRRIFYLKSMKDMSKLLDIPYKANKRLSPKNFALLISETEGLLLNTDYAFCFTDPENPFFKPRKADKDSLNIIMLGSYPDDIAKYIADNHLLERASIFTSQGKDMGKRIVQDNMRFLFAFYRICHEEYDWIDLL